MSKVYVWAEKTPDAIIAEWGSSVDDEAPAYESLVQVVEAFKERLMDCTMSYEVELYTSQLHPWFLDVSIKDIPEAAQPFIASALQHHFNGKDETGGTIFPVEQVRFSGDWIFMFGDIERANEITQWPWAEQYRH